MLDPKFKFENNQKWTQKTTKVVVPLQYCACVLLSFEQSFVEVQVKNKCTILGFVPKDLRIICSNGTWGLLHSSQHSLASDKDKQKTQLGNNVGADGGTVGCSPQSLSKSVSLLAIYSVLCLRASTGFAGSGSSNRACCLSLSFTSCTPQ